MTRDGGGRQGNGRPVCIEMAYSRKLLFHLIVARVLFEANVPASSSPCTTASVARPDSKANAVRASGGHIIVIGSERVRAHEDVGAECFVQLQPEPAAKRTDVYE